MTHHPPQRQRSAMQRLGPRAVGIPSVVILLTVAAVGCSGSDDSGGGASSAAPTSPPGCAEATALKQSVTALTEVSPVNDGLDALKSAATEVQTDLDATLSAVSSELQPSVDQVKTSFDDLRSILEGISDADGLGAAATEVGAGLSQVGRALTGLSDSIDQDC